MSDCGDNELGKPEVETDSYLERDWDEIGRAGIRLDSPAAFHLAEAEAAIDGLRAVTRLLRHNNTTLLLDKPLLSAIDTEGLHYAAVVLAEHADSKLCFVREHLAHEAKEGAR